LGLGAKTYLPAAVHRYVVWVEGVVQADPIVLDHGGGVKLHELPNFIKRAFPHRLVTELNTEMTKKLSNMEQGTPVGT